MSHPRTFSAAVAAGLLALNLLGPTAPAADQPQWGRGPSRNMVSDEKGLPASFDPATGKNIKWVADLGTESYASPVVSSGRVLIGTNNERPRDPKITGDRAVLLCLDERDGHLLWQLAVPKLSADENDPYLDWPKVGWASPPTVEGDRAYALSNRGEVLCIDLKGMADGNDGPFKDEAKHMAPRGSAPVEPGPADGDIVWACDLVAAAGIHTHDQVHGSVLIDGDLLYVNSCNGVDNTHRKIRSPDAPALVVLDKRTGRLVARDDRRIGPNTFHCNWSSPSIADVNGRRLVFFGGGDGICYTFEALKEVPAEGQSVVNLKSVWQYDPDPTTPKQDVHNWISNRTDPNGPSVLMGMPVYADGRIYLTAGGDLWWGKRRGWLKCVDAGTGKEAWSCPLARETCATPAVYNGMVFATDCAGTIHCVDSSNGKPIWTHKAVGDFWASVLVADGRVYAGTRRGQFVVLAADREKREIATIDLHDPISGTATAANGVLYVTTMKHLYALK